MRTARLVSISKKIPTNCPFANYDELRKYWIDMVFIQFVYNYIIIYFYKTKLIYTIIL